MPVMVVGYTHIVVDLLRKLQMLCKRGVLHILEGLLGSDLLDVSDWSVDQHCFRICILAELQYIIAMGGEYCYIIRPMLNSPSIHSGLASELTHNDVAIGIALAEQGSDRRHPRLKFSSCSFLPLIYCLGFHPHGL